MLKLSLFEGNKNGPHLCLSLKIQINWCCSRHRGRSLNSSCPFTSHRHTLKNVWKKFLCMLFEVVTIDLHYMTNRQEQFDLKISKF